MISIDTDQPLDATSAAAPRQSGQEPQCSASGTVATLATKTNRARKMRARLPSITISGRSAHCLRPSLLDPVGRRGRLVMAMARLRPIGRSGDVTNRDGDDPILIPGHERIFRIVLGEPGDRVLVTLVVVRPDVQITRRCIEPETLELADDHLVIGPTADQLVCP